MLKTHVAEHILKFYPSFAHVLSCLRWWAGECSVEERKLRSVSTPGFTAWPPAGYGEEIPATELSPPTVVCFAGIWLCWRDRRQMELVWEEKKIGLVKWNMNRRPTPVRRRFYEERRETLSFLPPFPYGKQHILRAKAISGARNTVGWIEVACVYVMRAHISPFWNMPSPVLPLSPSEAKCVVICQHTHSLFIFRSLSYRLPSSRELV